MNAEYCIVRILGNDLPPRHFDNQTILNLKFILDFEATFQHTTKLYILNRIIDKSIENEIISILNAYNQEYVVIPFEIDTDNYDVNWSKDVKMQRIIELNKARNIALEKGFKTSTWVFPLDGNIFIDTKGWNSITKGLSHSISNIVKLKMYRIKQDNSEIENFNLEEYDEQEEQIIFRKDCFVRFDETLGYGYSNKLQLLKNLTLAPSYNYVIRLNDFTYGFINAKRYKDRKKAIELLIDKVEKQFIY